MCNRRKGFTLIELLVVIAIIAILAAILFPVFAAAREKARASSCLSNCKQLALAIIMYAGDYDQYPPTGAAHPRCLCMHNGSAYWANDPSPVVGAGWSVSSVDQLYPYIKNRGIWHCPDDQGIMMSATDITNHGWALPSNLNNDTGWPTMFGCNCGGNYPQPCAAEGIWGSAGNMLAPYPTFAGDTGQKIGWSYHTWFDTRFTIDGPWPVDASGWHGGSPVIGDANWMANVGINSPAGYACIMDDSPWHNNGQNNGFYDGHAKWYNDPRGVDGAYGTVQE